MELKTCPRAFLAAFLEARTGQQLTLGRSWRIDTALAPVLRERGLSGLDQLVTILAGKREPALADAVIEALLNNETYFFRDRIPFDLLTDGPLKRLERTRAHLKRLSIWSAGCSTGQEPYSLAMLFADEPLRWRGWRIEIVGTDLSGSAVAKARAGLYTQFEVQRGLPVRQMVRWFTDKGAGQWAVADALKDQVRFEQRSLTEPPPHPGRFDIILCRNVLMYFSPEMRRETFMNLASAIAPDGALMLGAGETVLGQTDRFVSDRDHRGLYVPASASAAKVA